jgi:hypothetical protein
MCLHKNTNDMCKLRPFQEQENEEYFPINIAK